MLGAPLRVLSHTDRRAVAIRLRIALDIDSTLHHYWDQFSTVVERRFGIDMPYENQRDWGIGNLRPEQVAVVVAETHSAEFVLTAEPYPGAIETVKRWVDEGHWIHITSHRADEAYDLTAQWLNEVGLPHDDLHCSFDKISRCVELGIDLLVDDSPVNIENALAVGIIPATLSHPWNEEICEADGVISAADWPTLAGLLEPLLSDRPSDS